MSDQTKQDKPEPWAFPTPIAARSNLAGAETVEKGIAMQEEYGTRCAAEYLKNQMVSLDVVVRVLLRRSERRNYRLKNQGRQDSLYNTAQYRGGRGQTEVESPSDRA